MPIKTLPCLSVATNCQRVYFNITLWTLFLLSFRFEKSNDKGDRIVEGNEGPAEEQAKIAANITNKLKIILTYYSAKEN